MADNINVEKCVAYLRFMEIEVDAETEARWLATQREVRERRRRHRRELKKSCGHFRTYKCPVHHANGTTVQTICRDCNKILRHDGPAYGFIHYDVRNGEIVGQRMVLEAHTSPARKGGA